MKQSKPVSQAEVSQAIRRFVNKGGMIRKLPADKTGSGRVVGMKHNTSEIGGDATG